MSVGTLLTDHSTFVRYYNCGSYDVDYIPLERRRKPFVGALYITLGLLFQNVYIPCIWSLYKLSKSQKTFSCYRLMFFLGLVDCVGLTACALICGLFSFQGAVFCQQPVLMYIASTIGMMCWFAGTTTSVILSINRCLVIYDQDLAEQMFSGKRTLIWLCVPFFGSFIFVWLVPPVLFNSIDSSAIFNPHLHYLPDDPFYHSTVHLCYNWLIVLSIVVIYTIFGVFFYRKIRLHGGLSQVHNNRRLLKEIGTFLQVLITCTLVVFTSLGFIYQQYLASIPILVFTGYICHQGSPAVIYLCMNQTIRNTILKRYKVSSYTTKGYPASKSVTSNIKSNIKF